MLTFDDSRFPLVVWQFGEVHDDETTAEEARVLDRIFERRAPCVFLIDTRSVRSVSYTSLKLSSKLMRERREPLEAYLVAQALVISTPFIRGALRAFLWLAPMPTPYKVVETPAEGLAYLEAEAARTGLVLPKLDEPRATG